MSLGVKQAAFVAEYLVDLNATRAAIRAGYSARSAEQQACALLRNPKVRQAIDEALARRAARVEVKAEDVLRELVRLATVDVGEAFDECGRLKPLKDMSPEVRRAIAGVDVVELPGKSGVLRKVKFSDKARALELLGKHLKLWTDKVEHSVDASFAELLKAARERARRGTDAEPTEGA